MTVGDNVVPMQPGVQGELDATATERKTLKLLNDFGLQY